MRVFGGSIHENAHLPFDPADRAPGARLRFESLEKEVKTTAVAVVAACKKDKPKFCEKYKTLEEIKSCLKENEDHLSPECKQSLHL